MTEVVPQLLTESQTAKYLSVSRQFLRKSRMNGNRKGHAPAPPFIRFGRSIRYSIDDLQRWIEEHRYELRSDDGPFESCG
jgi:hypothetical protein